MPKPAKIIRPVYKKVAIPEDVVLRIDLELFSQVEARVPHGAWGELVTKLLSDHLVKLDDNREISRG